MHFDLLPCLKEERGRGPVLKHAGMSLSGCVIVEEESNRHPSDAVAAARPPGLLLCRTGGTESP